MTGSVTLSNGRVLPCLGASPDGRRFVIPLENGWNAYVVAFPRPDEVEYVITGLARSEADALVSTEGDWTPGWGNGLFDNPEDRPMFWPRGDDDLCDDLADMAQLPMPS